MGRKILFGKVLNSRGPFRSILQRKEGRKSSGQDFLIASSAFLLGNFLGKLMRNAWKTFHAQQTVQVLSICMVSAILLVDFSNFSLDDVKFMH